MDVKLYTAIRATCMAAIKSQHPSAGIEETSKALITLGCDVAEASSVHNIEPLLNLLYAITMALEGKLAGIQGVKNDSRNSDGAGSAAEGGANLPDRAAGTETSNGPGRGVEGRFPSE